MSNEVRNEENIRTEEERMGDIKFSKILAKKAHSHAIVFVKEKNPMGTIGKLIVPVEYNYRGGEKVTDENFDSVICDIYNSTLTPTYFTREEIREKMLESEENRELYKNDRKRFNKKLNNKRIKLNRRRLAEVIELDVSAQINYGIKPERKIIR